MSRSGNLSDLGILDAGLPAHFGHAVVGDSFFRDSVTAPRRYDLPQRSSTSGYLYYNSGTDEYEYKIPSSGASASTFSTLSAASLDVNYSLLLDGGVLQRKNGLWSGSGYRFPINAPSGNGYIISFNSDGTSSWVLASSGGVVALNDLTDVTIQAPAAGHYLYHDGSEWKNSSFGSAVSSLAISKTTPVIEADVMPDSTANARVFGSYTNMFSGFWMKYAAIEDYITLGDAGAGQSNIKLRPGSNSTGYNFYFPPNGGASGQTLQTDGNGTTSWGSTGPKEAVALATTQHLNWSYSGGSQGIGATLTALGNGFETIDSVTIELGDRVLVKNQNVAARNGIYVCTNKGSGNQCVLTRADDSNEASDFTRGEQVFVLGGNTNANGAFIFNSSATNMGVVGNFPINYYPFGSGGVEWAKPSASYLISDNGGTFEAEGPGIISGPVANPTIYVHRGLTYEFNVGVSGHQPELGQGSMFGFIQMTSGVTATATKLTWSVPYSSINGNTYYLRSSSSQATMMTVIVARELDNNIRINSISPISNSGLQIKDHTGTKILANFSTDNNTSFIKFHDVTGTSNSVTLAANPTAPITGLDVKFYLPNTNGLSGQVLQTDGTGVTSWVNQGGGSGASTLVALTDTDLPAVNSTPDTGYLATTNTMIYPKYPVAWNPNTDKFEIAYGIESGYNYRGSLQATGGKVNRVCIGRLSAAYGNDSVCIGNGHTNWNSTESIAIGGGSKGKNDGGSWVPNTHYDYTACFDADYAIAIGSPTTVKGDYSIAMGCESSALKPYCTVIGYDSFSDSSGGIAIGFKAKTNGDNQIVINASHSTGLTAGSSSDSLYINPIRPSAPAAKSVEQNGVLAWDATSKEVFVSANPVVACYELTAPSSSVYRVVGPGLPANADNPTIRVYCGLTYRFMKTSTIHPVELRATSGGAEIDTDFQTKTGSGATTVIMYSVPHARAGTNVILQCTSHSAMVVTLSIV